MLNQIVLRRLNSAFVGFTVLFVCFGNLRSQTTTSVSTEVDTVQQYHERRGAGGFEAGNGWRNDGFHGVFFHLFYEAEIGRTFLNAGAFSYQKFNDGFGFDFRLRMPFLFYPSGSHTNFSPLAGVSFTVWPILKPTVTVGFPIGLEYELPIENFPNISVGTNIAPQINLRAEKNFIIFDLRFGIRFD